MAGGGVHCYSSTDLYNWKDEGIVLPVDQTNPQSDIAAGCILERPKVIYNEATKTFVMFFKSYPKGTGYEFGYVGVATATRPNGPFTYRHRFLGCDSPNGSGDFVLVRDPSGAVYHLAVRKPDKVFCAGKLRDDYLFPAGEYHPVEGIELHTEAPAIVPRPSYAAPAARRRAAPRPWASSSKTLSRASSESRAVRAWSDSRPGLSTSIESCAGSRVATSSWWPAARGWGNRLSRSRSLELRPRELYSSASK